MLLIGHPDDETRLGDLLRHNLESTEWTEFRAAVAFVKASGVRHIADALTSFSTHGKVRISVGIDFGGTSVEGLEALWDCIEHKGDIWVCHNEAAVTFHPKLYLFRNDTVAKLFVGSGNLTEGGLFTNYEVFIALDLSAADPASAHVLAQVERMLERWSLEAPPGFAQKLDGSLLEALQREGYIESEASILHHDPAVERRQRPLFPTIFPWPVRSKFRESARTSERSVVLAGPRGPEGPVYSGFLMTLHQTDVGVGQIVPGTSRRSPEIFIPLRARDYAPAFWGWPGEFTQDPKKLGKKDRRVKVRLGDDVFEAVLMTWPDKHDLRLRSEKVRTASRIGDLLWMRRSAVAEYSYDIEIVPKGSEQFYELIDFCVNRVPGRSSRIWGYHS
jgi:HKD family nuclease